MILVSVDSMKAINGRNFTTKDSDNDLSSNNCAVTYGAWWYASCSNSMLNYDMKKSKKLYWRGFKYIKSTMMIRLIS